MIELSRGQARRFLASYHFTQTDMPGVFARLGTVQYDPLNPVGRNPDLVFQARIAKYRVDDWKSAAYDERIIYDTWDKNACLVPISDWPMRAIAREQYRAYHDREILQAHPQAVEEVLAAIDARGPLCSLDFEDRAHYGEHGSWYGSTLPKRILRALWACGILLTHHRTAGRHYYDRPEHVIPSQYFNTPPLLDEDAYHRWIIARRVYATGLLREIADATIWKACGNAATRKQALAQLVEQGVLTPVRVEGKSWTYYTPTSTLPLLDAPALPRRVLFLGPLDSLLWDRKAIQHIFDFDYLWEVYKPEPQRRWGYYVLPIFYDNRFIARLDSRLDGQTWTISKWWWEPDVIQDDELRAALRNAVQRFLYYLRANEVVGIDL